MSRALCLSLLLCFAAGCLSPAERAPLQPLPEDGPPLPYAELLTRARLQATAGTEAFYVNKWADLEDVARGLEQTARYLDKATDVPETHRDTLMVRAGDLGKESSQLREAAKARDVDKANQSLQRIHLLVRELRLDQTAPGPPKP